MIVEFPAILHLRCSQAMASEVKARGGSRWLRALIDANTRPPEPAPVTRVTRRSHKRLDGRKGARVKSRVSRGA